jgi:CheY-like chemotaxis protein
MPTPHYPFRYDLAGRRVLIVEDEYLIADDMRQAFLKCGAEIVGPAPNLRRASELLHSGQRIDLAVLDINLQGEAVYPVAHALKQRGIPFMFATGYEKSSIPREYEHVPHWEKPFDYDALARVIPSMFGRA